MRTARIHGWGGFAAWALVGALFSLSVLGAASIGLFVMPLALLALLVAGRTVQRWPDMAGVLAGVAGLTLFVAIANRSSTPCPGSGSSSIRVGGNAGGASFACGGLDPLPWLSVGVALAAAAFAVYGLARRSR